MIKIKSCPEGKELNPITKRCGKKCKEFEIRDSKTGYCKASGKCPEDKEFNPITKRCIKKCKDGEIRNVKTRMCEKIKQPKPSKPIPSSKKCPEGKELNPITKRCGKKCKEFEIRDSKTGHCKASGKCPEDKEFNPITKRCIKKCKDGEIRNVKTRMCEKIKQPKPSKPIKLQKPTKLIKQPLPPRTPSPPKDSPLPPRTPSPPKDSPLPPRTPSPPKDSPLPPRTPSPPKDSSLPSKTNSSLSSKKNSKGSDNDIDLYYPDIDDSDFEKKIARNKEFSIHKIRSFPTIRTVEDFNKVANELCGKFETTLYQHFISQYLSHRTPYKSIMLYYGVGVGKTCTAITLTEMILSTKTMDTTEPHIWVIMPQALEENFNKEIFNYDIKVFKKLFNQCTGDNYVKLLNINESSFNEKDNKDNIKRLLKNRYEIFTYDSFMKRINEKYKDNIVENKVIIIDEAHNIRSTNNKEKGTYSTLKKILENGRNNRLILLSATPMYNEPRDILDLFNLMLINDKRDNILKEYYNVFNNNNKFKFDDKAKKLIKKLSSNYISYLKGKNPFTFALKLKASYNSNIKILNVEPTKDPSNNSIPIKELGWLKYINDDIVISKLGICQKNKIEALKKIINKINYNNIQEIDENELNDIAVDAVDGADGADADAEGLSQSKSQNQNMRLLQPMNIVYDNDIGKVGFNSFFRNIEGTASISVNYSEKYKNALYPTEEYLGKYSGKFLNICNIIRKSEGIVVIYSRFAWAGIIPLAICLEHLGYSREGTNNILKNAEIVKDKPVYKDVSNPKYCIMTSDKKEIMGSTTINNLIKKINDDKNINGKDIKVILITQVASEGLSFYNAREIHLIEPWYHFNRPDQIIGRGIRNCRHQKLPFEKRNVTVFMHASANDDAEMQKTETIDIHALRISTRKYIESKEIDKIISGNSLDCSLMKNINYFPKKLFEMGTVDILTSQGNKIKYELGDNEDLEPSCGFKDDGAIAETDDISGYRSDVYKHLLKRTQAAIKNKLLKMIEDDVYYISYKELIDDIGEDIDIDEEILIYTINKSIRPAVIIDNYYIEHHNQGIKLSIIDDIIGSRNGAKATMAKIKIKMNVEGLNDTAVSVLDNKNSDDDIDNILKIINIDYTNIISTTISIYFNLDDKIFKRLVEYIIVNYAKLGDLEDNRKAELMYVIKCLDSQGVFIRKKELPSYNKNNNNDYIGYINIYNIENKNNEDIKNLDISLYNNVEKRWSESLTITEQKEFAKYRNSKIIVIPENMELEEMPWGIIEPQFIKKDNIIKNTFKIFSTDAVVGKGKKIGRVCTFYNKTEHNNFIKQIEKDNVSTRNFKDIKEMLCKHIAHKLMENKKLVLFPLFK
jgi:superfamily II DNA or RNA helicase